MQTVVRTARPVVRPARELYHRIPACLLVDPAFLGLSPQAHKLFHLILALCLTESRSVRESSRTVPIGFGEFAMTKRELAARTGISLPILDRSLDELGPDALALVRWERLGTGRHARTLFQLFQPERFLYGGPFLDDVDQVHQQQPAARLQVVPRQLDLPGVRVGVDRPADPGPDPDSSRRKFDLACTRVPEVQKTARQDRDESESESPVQRSGLDLDRLRALAAGLLQSWTDRPADYRGGQWTPARPLPLFSQPLPADLEPDLARFVDWLVPFVDQVVPVLVAELAPDPAGFDRSDPVEIRYLLDRLVDRVYSTPWTAGKVLDGTTGKPKFRAALRWLAAGKGRDRAARVRALLAGKWDPREWEAGRPRVRHC